MIDISEEYRSSCESNGFLIVDNLIDESLIQPVNQAFSDLFSGCFETGVRPDEVNWQKGENDPSLTRQICNGWKANRTIAKVVLSAKLGRTICKLTGWEGTRIMIDNVLWKPPGAKSLGFHQDSAYLSWFSPSDLCTCWIALDNTTAEGGTLEYIKGSHRWQLSTPTGEFHAPDNYLSPMETAAKQKGVNPEITYVEVPAGGGAFHHGYLWHGSGPNRAEHHRRSLALHAMRSDVTLVPTQFHQGIGPVYGRYRRLSDNEPDENHFPILWRADKYRTPGLDDYIRGIYCRQS